MKFLIVLVFLFPAYLIGQCSWTDYYSGTPGNIKSDSISVKPGNILQIDFCTFNIPDKLTIFNLDGTELNFNIGSLIFTPNWPVSTNDYRGYCEFEYSDGTLFANQIMSPIVPWNLYCSAVGTQPGGTLRIYYHIPAGQCLFKFMVSGSVLANTVYDICIIEYPGDEIISDTIIVNTCSEEDEYFRLVGCDNVLFIPINHEIKTDTIVLYPKCLGDLGSIQFTNYPDYDVFGIEYGNFDIEVSNQFCSKTFSFEFLPKELCDETFYIPNVFSPNKDGINDEFLMFTIIPYNYRLRIYDRWGELIFNQDLISNFQGWNGDRCQSGVYVWEIFCLDKHLFGDVTLIR